jgi:PQQ-dependent catabolism-associated CXXCW motif protein
MRTLALLAMLLSAGVVGAQAQDGFGGGQQPPRPNPPPPAQGGGYGQQQAGGNDAAEGQDFGVAPTSQLKTGGMHGPTPTTIPGGMVITTGALVSLLGNQQVKPVLLDILGGPEILPGAIAASPAAQPGSFTDETQRGFGQFLQQQTQGNMETPIVLYCLSNQCWMSYNAALRAINMGYKNVLWYRGGIEAWKAAGQQVQPAPRR